MLRSIWTPQVVWDWSASRPQSLNQSELSFSAPRVLNKLPESCWSAATLSAFTSRLLFLFDTTLYKIKEFWPLPSKSWISYILSV